MQTTDELRGRRLRLQRVVLEQLPMDSDAYRDHQLRLARARGDLSAIVAAYEQTVAMLTPAGRHAPGIL